MKKFISVALFLAMCLILATAASASYGDRLYDGADLLTAMEEDQILLRLDDVSRKYGVDVVIVTVDTVGYQSLSGFSDDYYDENGYDEDCVILLVSMAEREWDILTNGSCYEAITSSGIDSIGELMTDDLSEGNYVEAFETYISRCEYYINGHANGYPFEWGPTLLISLLVGLTVALIVTSIMKAQLKSVRANDTATEYVRRGSMNIKVSRDIFLYRHVSRIKKPESNSGTSRSGGGGRGHGGGKF